MSLDTERKATYVESGRHEMLSCCWSKAYKIGRKNKLLTFCTLLHTDVKQVIKLTSTLSPPAILLNANTTLITTSKALVKLSMCSVIFID